MLFRLNANSGSVRREIVTASLLAIITLSCFSCLVGESEADTYNQIPLWINVMEGAAVDEVSIEKTMDQIFKDNGLNWRVTSVVLSSNYTDPDKSKDQPGDVRVAKSGFTAEENSTWDAGAAETKNKGGFKVFVVGNILDENGTDANANGVARPSRSTAIVAQPSAADPPIGGDTWAHEIGHLLGLDDQRDPGTEGNLMHVPRSTRNGTALSADDIAKINATKTERDLGLPSLTEDQMGRTYDMYRYLADDLVGDSVYVFTDIAELCLGFYILDGTQNLHVTTFLEGMILPGIALTYQIVLDTDNDPATGGIFMGMPGIDYLVEVHILYPEIVEAILYKYPEHIQIMPLQARVDSHYKFIDEEDSTVSATPDSGSIVATIPLQALIPLGGEIGVGAYLQSADGLGTDTLEKTLFSTSPPSRPSITLTPATSPSGRLTTVQGSGFTPGHPVSILFGHDEVTNAMTDPAGNFETFFINPVLSPDHYMIDAVGTDNNIAVAMLTLTIAGDINGDFKVSLQDLVSLANAYGSKPGDLKWRASADINGNEVVDLADLVILALHYGQHYP